MNTAKRLNDLNLPPLPRKPSRFGTNRYLPVMGLAVVLGTLLDIYFVGKGLYSFPMRPFPELFSFNIGFTFFVLPVFVWIFLHLMKQLNKWGKIGLVLFLSLLAPIFEKFSEVIGFFRHSDQWQHIYSFFGYLVFLSVMYWFYRWLERPNG